MARTILFVLLLLFSNQGLGAQALIDDSGFTELEEVRLEVKDNFSFHFLERRELGFWKLHALKDELSLAVDDLKEAWEDEEIFNEKRQALFESYQSIKFYYHVQPNDMYNMACLVVDWESRFQDNEVRFCGRHTLDRSLLHLDIRTWSMDKMDLSGRQFDQQEAEQLLEFAQAAFSIYYSNPQNQAILINDINEWRMDQNQESDR